MTQAIWGNRRRRIVTLCVLAVAVGAGTSFLLLKQTSVAAENGAALVVYSGPNFTGRSLRVTGNLPDLPKGVLFDWNDTISSIVVLRGTWRLYENGRFNTFLDKTPATKFDVSKQPPVGGWSCVVSADKGPVELTPESSGWADNSISSIELLSTERLVSPMKDGSRHSTAEAAIVIHEHINRGGRTLTLHDSVAALNSGWENTTSSLEVKGGTWRLYQLPNFDRMGWYVDVAGEDLIHEASESGGWTNDDLSSIELLSADVERPAWAILKRKRR